MGFFIYSFLTESGDISKDIGSYESVDELYEHVESAGKELYSFFEIPDFLAPAYRYFTIGKPKLRDISEFIRNISVYLESGIAIQGALDDLKDSVENKAIKYAAKQMLDMLDEGYAFSEALDKVGMFPKIVISMAKIGETSGGLEKTLKDAADYLDRVIAIRSATKRALIYPTFSLFAVFGAFAFWIVYVLPQITELFKSQGIDLPLATRMLIAISDFTTTYWYVIVLFIVGLIVSFPFLLKMKRFRLLFHYALWKMPIVGMIIRCSQTAFYFQYLSLLTTSGVTITESLSTMEFAITNDYFLSRIGGMLDNLKNGETLSEAAKEAKVFELIVLRMIAVGEETGNMDSQMKRLSDMYYEKVQNMVEIIGKLIEPIVLGFIGVMFIFFVLALISPIYGMLGNMTK